MRFWSPSLKRINEILANLYSDRDTATRLADWENLPIEEIPFSHTAINNWYHILVMARKRGVLKEFLENLVTTSQNKELTDAYDTYLKTPTILGGGKPVLSFLKNVWRWVIRRWKVVTAVLASVLGLTVVGVTVIYYFVPRTVSGYVSCLTPDHDKGNPVEKATVHLLGTPYKTTTNQDGSFNLSVPRKITVNNAEVLFGYGKYPVQLSHAIDNQLQVVKCPSIPEPKPKNIPFDWWKEETDRAQGAIKCDTNEDFPQVVRYTLASKQPIERGTELGDLIVNVVAIGEWQILEARVTRPLSTGPTQQFAETTGLRTVSARQWGFEMPGVSLEIRIQVCFGTPWRRQKFSEANLDSNYYFQ